MLKMLLTALALCIVFAPQQAWSEDAGIAAKYHGDESIESDPDVLFAENFEADGIRHYWK
jgi:hypothetical protein